MGKKQVRVIVIRKWMTIALLALTTAAMMALIYYLSGRAYAPETHTFRDMLMGLFRGTRRPPRDAILAGLMPVIANTLLFVPWGFLLFLSLDSATRPRRATYLITILAGLLFAAAINVWQQFLPTRVTSYADVAANAAGAFLGAIAGHLRKTVHVQFDF
jgi:VanZ family protein